MRHERAEHEAAVPALSTNTPARRGAAWEEERRPAGVPACITEIERAMSFEYELRPTFADDSEAAIARLDEDFRARGAASNPAFGGALSLEIEPNHTAALYCSEDHLLLVLETLTTFRLPAMREFLAVARSTGFSIHDEGDDAPLDWDALPRGETAPALAWLSRLEPGERLSVEIVAALESLCSSGPPWRDELVHVVSRSGDVRLLNCMLRVLGDGTLGQKRMVVERIVTWPLEEEKRDAERLALLARMGDAPSVQGGAAYALTVRHGDARGATLIAEAIVCSDAEARDSIRDRMRELILDDDIRGQVDAELLRMGAEPAFERDPVEMLRRTAEVLGLPGDLVVESAFPDLVDVVLVSMPGGGLKELSRIRTQLVVNVPLAELRRRALEGRVVLLRRVPRRAVEEAIVELGDVASCLEVRATDTGRSP